MLKVFAVLFLLLSVLTTGCTQKSSPDLPEEIPSYDSLQETWGTRELSGEESEVHQLVFDYLSLKQVDFLSEVDHVMDDYFVPEIRDTLEEQLFWKVFRFEKLVRSTIQDKILWEEFDIIITNILLDADTATVDAYEAYAYELSEAEDSISSRGTGYTFTCQKIEGRWYIKAIDTDNALIEAQVDGYSAEELPKLAGVLDER